MGSQVIDPMAAGSPVSTEDELVGVNEYDLLVFHDGCKQVSLYAVDRVYGGPEEGGWWWNRRVFQHISYRVPAAEAEATRAAMLARVQHLQPEHNIYSMANEGPQYEVDIEDACGEGHRTATPHYE